MGKIKKILENELVGGTQTTDVYPVTSTKAVYDENNKRLDNILGDLRDRINVLKNAGYLYAVIATPTTDPGAPNAKVFYIANGKGTYINFRGIEVTEDEVVVLYYDTAWHKVATGIASQEKLSELESESNISYSSVSYLLNFFPHQTINTSGEIKPSLNAAVTELIKVDNNKNIIVTTGYLPIVKYIILYDDSGYLDYYSIAIESTSREINTLNASYIQFVFSLKDINIVSVKDGENVIWAPKHDDLIENKLKIIEENTLKNESTIDSIIGNYSNYIENSSINELGIINSHATFSTSPLINIAAATTIKIFYGTIAETSLVVFYDENKKFIDYFGLASTDTSRHLPNEGYSYMRFSFNKTGLIKDEKDNILWESMVFSDKIKDNSDKVNYIINYTPDTTISLNGNISKLKGIALSEYIPVHGDMIYQCTHGFNVEGVIAVYDANKEFIDYFTIPQAVNYRNIDPVGASYIRMPFNLLNIRDIEIASGGEIVWRPSYIPDIIHNIDDRVEILERGKDNRYTYDGEPIILQSLEYYTMFINPHQGKIQDACCYQDTMFQFFLQETYDNPACIVYDLITGEKIQEMDVPHGYYSHNNSAVFGSEKYDKNDEFPLLYLSTLQRVTGQPTLDVFRITGTRGNYQCELVQTITIESSYREPTCFIDKQENMLYVAWITGEVDTFEKYSLPKLSDGNNIVIPVSSKLDTFTISNRYPYGTTIGEPEQGGEIYRGKLYYAMGFKSCAWLIVIDLQKKEIVSSIDFTGIGLDYEPEGAFVWNGYLCVPFNESGKVVRFSFM